MAALVEVHDHAELDAALESGPAIIGVNNRNLHTFEVTLETSLRLAEHIPEGLIRVSESGIENRAANRPASRGRISRVPDRRASDALRIRP